MILKPNARSHLKFSMKVDRRFLPGARRLLLGLVALLVLVSTGCSPEALFPPTTSPAPTPTRMQIAPNSNTRVPDVKAAARVYLDAWKAEDYRTMYSMLTSVSQAALSEEEFTNHYRGVASEAALQSVDYEILSSLIQPDSAQIGYRVHMQSSLVGAFSRETVMNLSLERGQWRVQWDDVLVLPELAGGNYLRMDLSIPARANIYDRNGHALVAEQSNAVAIGLYPSQLIPEQMPDLLQELSDLLQIPEHTIQARIDDLPAGSDWYLPLGEVSADRLGQRYNVLAEFGGLIMRAYKSRYYFGNGVAPHVVGYVSQIQPEEVEEYKRRGYRPDERVGRSGLERWGEEYLSGKRGGSLYVLNSQGQPVTRLAESNPEPAQSIYTTIDREFQVEAQKALAGFRGAAVVLERDTGRVLAMVSSPGFDPNAFEPTNYNFNTLLSDLFADPGTPLLNRATQGLYPLGSVFKVITMAAALESGVYEPDSTYFCGSTFTDLPGVTLYDWTYEYNLPASGELTLPQGLIRSCNPWFYHIGLTLYEQGLATAVTDMARGFGLGAPTGIQGVSEEAGQVPDPENEIDATNGAIGQGGLLVTPLQVADFIAAVGNGGTLYRPQLVERIASPDGEASYTFEPDARAELPIGEDTLQELHLAMVGVIRNEQPRGTAWHSFTGLDIPVAGKTGTAQNPAGLPHAWFAGYSFAERADAPDIAIAVIVENIGEGSDYAAPIFRRLVELYFTGQASKFYPWETSIGVTATPTPEAEGTAVPQDESSPEPTTEP